LVNLERRVYGCPLYHSFDLIFNCFIIIMLFSRFALKIYSMISFQTRNKKPVLSQVLPPFLFCLKKLPKISRKLSQGVTVHWYAFVVRRYMSQTLIEGLWWSLLCPQQSHDYNSATGKKKGEVLENSEDSF
jgi:hypothetical protein